MPKPNDPARPGINTTEFWLVLAITVITPTLAYLEKIDTGWPVAAVIILNGLYALLRSAIKSKSLS